MNDNDHADLASKVVSMFERSEYVKEWPEDEIEYFRNGDWSSFTERGEVLQRMRAEKIIAALASTPSPAQPTEAGKSFVPDATVAMERWKTHRMTANFEQLRMAGNQLLAALESALAPSPVQGADDRLAQAEAVIAEIEAWRREPFAGNAEGGIRWTALDHIFRDYQQCPQAALNEVRAGALEDAAKIADAYPSAGGHTEHVAAIIRERAAELRANTNETRGE